MSAKPCAEFPRGEWPTPLVTLLRQWVLQKEVEQALHYQKRLNVTAYGTKTFRKICLGLGLKTYCTVPPTDFGITILLLWYSGVKAGNPIRSLECANCTSHYMSEPPVSFQKSTFRFNDAEPSWSVKRTQSSAVCSVPLTCRISDTTFSRETEMVSVRELHQKSLSLSNSISIYQ